MIYCSESYVLNFLLAFVLRWYDINTMYSSSCFLSRVLYGFLSFATALNCECLTMSRKTKKNYHILIWNKMFQFAQESAQQSKMFLYFSTHLCSSWEDKNGKLSFFYLAIFQSWSFHKLQESIIKICSDFLKQI